MTQLNPYILFNGNCREAMTFYRDCLGGDLLIQSVGESALAGQMPPAMHNNVMHSVLTKDGMSLMASDMGGPGVGKPTEAIALMLMCNSEENLRATYDKLAEGGSTDHKPEATFWGATFGDLTDKFGVRWMLNFDKNTAK